MKQQKGSDSVTAHDVHAFTPSMLRPDDRDAFLAVRDYFTGHGIDVTVHGSALEGDRSYQDIDLALSGSYFSILNAVTGLVGPPLRLRFEDSQSLEGSLFDLDGSKRSKRSTSVPEPSLFNQATGLEASFGMIGRRRYLGMVIDGDFALRVGDTPFELSVFYDR